MIFLCVCRGGRTLGAPRICGGHVPPQAPRSYAPDYNHLYKTLHWNFHALLRHSAIGDVYDFQHHLPVPKFIFNHYKYLIRVYITFLIDDSVT